MIKFKDDNDAFDRNARKGYPTIRTFVTKAARFRNKGMHI